MRKFYPYLEDQTFDKQNELDAERGFLAEASRSLSQKRQVKITLLNWQEQPIKEIQGEITSGSITKNGSSPVRRSCSMTVSFNGGTYDIDDIEAEFSINKKVYVEVGIKNYTNKFKEYPVLWFPQGVFFISSFSLSSSATGSFNGNISLKDKMCGLNGDVGGVFPAATILDQEDTQNVEGDYISAKVRIYNIIRELVHHYGGEPLDNIVIEDVPLKIKRVVRWMGESPLYLIRHNDDAYVWYEASLIEPTDSGDGYQVYEQTMDCGYVYSDFTYIGDLSANMGESVTSVLDKIKNYLGNYEYFYDVYGTFHFREIRNYLNTTQAESLLTDMGYYTSTTGNFENTFVSDGINPDNYLIDVTSPKVVFSFEDKNDIISISTTPNYGNIKNDYIIQGTRQGTSDNAKIMVMYHLAIDQKPQVGGTYYNLVFYKVPADEVGAGEVRPKFPKSVDTRDKLPAVGNFNEIYHIKDENAFVYWKDDKYKDVDVQKYYADVGEAQGTYQNAYSDYSKLYSEIANDQTLTQEECNAKLAELDATRKQDVENGDRSTASSIISNKVAYGGYVTKDWRTELYLQGLMSSELGIDTSTYYTNLSLAEANNESAAQWQKDIVRGNLFIKTDVDYYFEELDAYWPQIYDMVNQRFYGEDPTNSQKLFSTLCDGNYYLDFIDPQTSGLGEYSVQNIGRRVDAVNSDEVNCLFQPEIPNVIWINVDADTVDSDTDALLPDGVGQVHYVDHSATVAQCQKEGQPYSQVRAEIYDNFDTGGYKNGAFDLVKSELWTHTSYQKSVNITAIPLFSLEPNSRIHINDSNTNTYGDFMVSNISIPLAATGTMSVSCTECVQKM